MVENTTDANYIEHLEQLGVESFEFLCFFLGAGTWPVLLLLVSESLLDFIWYLNFCQQPSA